MSRVKRSIDRGSPVPLYQQIKATLLREIQEADADAPADPLTERKIIARFGVSRAPVRQALKELSDEGYLYRQRSKGTFPVRGVQVNPPALRLGGLTRYLAAQGLTATSRISEAGRVRAPETVRERLGLGGDADVYVISRLVKVQDEPLIWSSVYFRVPDDFDPDVQDLEPVGSVFELLDRDPALALTRGEHTIWASAASGEDAEILGVATGAPVLVMETLMFRRDGQVGGWRRMVHRAEDYKFVFTVGR